MKKLNKVYNKATNVLTFDIKQDKKELAYNEKIKKIRQSAGYYYNQDLINELKGKSEYQDFIKMFQKGGEVFIGLSIGAYNPPLIYSLQHFPPMEYPTLKIISLTDFNIKKSLIGHKFKTSSFELFSDHLNNFLLKPKEYSKEYKKWEKDNVLDKIKKSYFYKRCIKDGFVPIQCSTYSELEPNSKTPVNKYVSLFIKQDLDNDNKPRGACIFRELRFDKEGIVEVNTIKEFPVPRTILMNLSNIYISWFKKILNESYQKELKNLDDYKDSVRKEKVKELDNTVEIQIKRIENYLKNKGEKNE